MASKKARRPPTGLTYEQKNDWQQAAKAKKAAAYGHREVEKVAKSQRHTTPESPTSYFRVPQPMVDSQNNEIPSPSQQLHQVELTGQENATTPLTDSEDDASTHSDHTKTSSSSGIKTEEDDSTDDENNVDNVQSTIDGAQQKVSNEERQTRGLTSRHSQLSRADGKSNGEDIPWPTITTRTAEAKSPKLESTSAWPLSHPLLEQSTRKQKNRTRGQSEDGWMNLKLKEYLQQISVSFRKTLSWLWITFFLRCFEGIMSLATKIFGSVLASVTFCCMFILLFTSLFGGQLSCDRALSVVCKAPLLADVCLASCKLDIIQVRLPVTCGSGSNDMSEEMNAMFQDAFTVFGGVVNSTVDLWSLPTDLMTSHREMSLRYQEFIYIEEDICLGADSRKSIVGLFEEVETFFSDLPEALSTYFGAVEIVAALVLFQTKVTSEAIDRIKPGLDDPGSPLTKRSSWWRNTDPGVSLTARLVDYVSEWLSDVDRLADSGGHFLSRLRELQKNLIKLESALEIASEKMLRCKREVHRDLPYGKRFAIYWAGSEPEETRRLSAAIIVVRRIMSSLTSLSNVIIPIYSSTHTTQKVLRSLYELASAGNYHLSGGAKGLHNLGKILVVFEKHSKEIQATMDSLGELKLFAHQNRGDEHHQQAGIDA